MAENLLNRTALVTGGAQGIGQGIVECLVAQGAKVTIADINPAHGEVLAETLTKQGYDVMFVHIDILSEIDIKTAIDAHIDHFNNIDILVNNVGRNQHFDASKMTTDEWQTSLNLNLRGAWLCSKHVLPVMAEQGRGVIINIASVHATMTLYNNFPYNVAKSGILGLTRSLALDWGAKGIRVVAVSPGYVRTQPVMDGFNQADEPEAEEQRVVNLHPIRRIGEPRDVGNLVAFLASDAAGYITGTEIVIDGGISARYAD